MCWIKFPWVSSSAQSMTHEGGPCEVSAGWVVVVVGGCVAGVVGCGVVPA